MKDKKQTKDVSLQLGDMMAKRVPLVAVEGMDIVSSLASVNKFIRTEFNKKEGVPEVSGFSNFDSAFHWSASRGLQVIPDLVCSEESELQLELVKKRMQTPNIVEPTMVLEAFVMIAESVFDDTNGGSVLVVQGLDKIVSDENSMIMAVTAELLTLREQLDNQNSMLIGVGVSFVFPSELSDSFAVIKSPLPSLEARQNMVEEVIGDYKDGVDRKSKQTGEKLEIKSYTLDDIDDLSSILSGSTSFGAEQSLYLALSEQGIIRDVLIEKKKEMINSTKGLRFSDNEKTFDDLGGLSNIKEYFTRLIGGKLNIKLVVQFDEIEKAVSTGAGDNSGGGGSSVDTAFLGKILSFMQDKGIYGALFTGIYGCAKSAFTKSVATQANAIAIEADIGSMKDSLVGNSEKNLDRVLQVFEDVGQEGDIIFVATCNRIASLPPELRRRFNLGTFFFTFPDEDEKPRIWDIYKKKYGIAPEDTVNDSMWTGAEIENCCRQSWLLDCSLKEASQYITPVHKVAEEEIKQLIDQAHNRFLSASYTGLFNKAKSNPVAKSGAKGRSVNL